MANSGINEILEQLNTLTNKEKLISDRVNEINTTSDQTKLKLASILENIEEIKKRIQGKIETILALQDNNNKLSELLRLAQQKLRGDNSEDLDIESSIDNQLNRLKELGVKNETLEYQFNELKAKKEELEGKQTEYESNKEQLESKIKKLQDVVNESTLERTNMSSEYDTRKQELENEISNLNSKNKSLSEELNTLKSEKETLNENLKQMLESQAMSNEETIHLQERFNTEKSQLESQIKLQREELDKCNKSVNELFDKFKALNKSNQNDNIDNVINGLTEEFNRLTNDIDSKQNEITKLNEQLTQTQQAQQADKQKCNDIINNNLSQISTKIKEQDTLIDDLLVSIKDPDLKKMAESIEIGINEILNMTTPDDSSLYPPLPPPRQQIQQQPQQPQPQPVKVRPNINGFITDDDYSDYSDIGRLHAILLARYDEMQPFNREKFTYLFEKIKEINQTYDITFQELKNEALDLYNKLVMLIDDTSDINPKGKFSDIMYLLKNRTTIGGVNSNTRKRLKRRSTTRGKRENRKNRNGKQTKHRKYKIKRSITKRH